MAWRRHVVGAGGAYGGAPYGATKRVRVRRRHVVGAAGAFAGVPYGGHETCEGCAEIG